ncbi:hypothetical protein GCM10027406_31520 [Leifsonia lichenia]
MGDEFCDIAGDAFWIGRASEPEQIAGAGEDHERSGLPDEREQGRQLVDSQKQISESANGEFGEPFGPVAAVRPPVTDEHEITRFGGKYAGLVRASDAGEEGMGGSALDAHGWVSGRMPFRMVLVRSSANPIVTSSCVTSR